MNHGWKLQAECRSIPPDVFFPSGRKDARARAVRVEVALAICRRCPVRAQCADAALETGAMHGVFAGVDLGDGSQRLDPATEMKLRSLAEGAS